MSIKNYKNKRNLTSGFTIIEALVAIFILSVSVASMLGLTATSQASARYANNEITANYLLQEALDSIRNSRDTIAFQKKDNPQGGWQNFLDRYGFPYSSCFSSAGCMLNIEEFDTGGTGDSDVTVCSVDEGCSFLYFDDTQDEDVTSVFYNYSEHGSPSIFKRTVNMETSKDKDNLGVDGKDEIKVTVKVEWRNGDNTTVMSRQLVSYFLNWQK